MAWRAFTTGQVRVLPPILCVPRINSILGLGTIHENRADLAARPSVLDCGVNALKAVGEHGLDFDRVPRLDPQA